MNDGPDPSEIQPETHEPGVHLAHPDAVAEHVVPRDPGHRVHVPVDADGDVVRLPAPDRAAVQVDARPAGRELPGAETTVDEKRVTRPHPVDGAVLSLVGAILAGEKPARLHVVAVEV